MYLEGVMRIKVAIFLFQFSWLANAAYPHFETLSVNKAICAGFKTWVFGGRDIQASFPKVIDNRSPEEVTVKLMQDGKMIHSSHYFFHKDQDKHFVVLSVRDELTEHLDIALEIEYFCSACNPSTRTYVIPSVYEYKYIGEGMCEQGT